MTLNGDTLSSRECAFIEDGYTNRGYIARRPQLHPAIVFEFRPMVQAQCARAKYMLEHARTPEEGEAQAAIAIAKQLVTWDVRKRNGDHVEITTDNVLRIHPAAFYDMWCQVLGVRGPDAMPKADNATELHSTLGDGARQEEIDAKN